MLSKQRYTRSKPSQPSKVDSPRKTAEQLSWASEDVQCDEPISHLYSYKSLNGSVYVSWNKTGMSNFSNPVFLRV